MMKYWVNTLIPEGKNVKSSFDINRKIYKNVVRAKLRIETNKCEYEILLLL